MTVEENVFTTFSLFPTVSDSKTLPTPVRGQVQLSKDRGPDRDSHRVPPAVCLYSEGVLKGPLTSEASCLRRWSNINAIHDGLTATSSGVLRRSGVPVCQTDETEPCRGRYRNRHRRTIWGPRRGPLSSVIRCLPPVSPSLLSRTRHGSRTDNGLNRKSWDPESDKYTPVYLTLQRCGRRPRIGHR